MFLISGLNESILEECLQYLEKQLESSQVRKAMEEFFSFRYILHFLLSLRKVLHIMPTTSHLSFVVVENWFRS